MCYHRAVGPRVSRPSRIESVCGLDSLNAAAAAKVTTAPEGEPLTFHGLRHHFASWFMMRGGRLEVLSKILGHSTLQMTQRYAHLSPDYLRVEMAKTERAAAVHDASREQEVVDSTPLQITA